MQRDCPEWAAYIGVVVRLITNETDHPPPAMVDLLRQIDEREAAARPEIVTDAELTDPKCAKN